MTPLKRRRRRISLVGAGAIAVVGLLTPHLNFTDRASSAAEDPVTHGEFCRWVITTPNLGPEFCLPVTTTTTAAPTTTSTVPVTIPVPVNTLTGRVFGTTIVVSWTGPTPTKLGRDGVDVTGFGAWDTDTLGFGGVPKGVSDFAFTGMLPGATYKITATRVGGNQSVNVTMPGVIVTPPTVPTTTPPVTPPVGSRVLGAGLFQYNERVDADVFTQRTGAAVDVYHAGVASNDCSGAALFAPDRDLQSWLKENPQRILVSNWNLESGALTDFAAYRAAANCYANLISNAGLAKQVVVRPGYEPNAWWMGWGNQAPGNANGDAYKALWRDFAPIFHAKGIKLDWSVVPGPASGPDDPATWWPGDDPSYKPDYATMDQYDWYMGDITGQARWDTFLSVGNGHGLPWLKDFAKAHGIKWGVDETAVASRDCNGIGEDPFWMTHLLDWLNAGGASWVLYENVPDGGVCTDLYSNPQTLKAWGDWFKARPVWAGVG